MKIGMFKFAALARRLLLFSLLAALLMSVQTPLVAFGLPHVTRMTDLIRWRVATQQERRAAELSMKKYIARLSESKRKDLEKRHAKFFVPLPTRVTKPGNPTIVWQVGMIYTFGRHEDMDTHTYIRPVRS